MYVPVRGIDEVYNLRLEVSQELIDKDNNIYKTRIEEIYIKEKLTVNKLAEIILTSLQEYTYPGMTYENLCYILKTIYGVAGTLCERISYLLNEKLNLYTIVDSQPLEIINQKINRTNIFVPVHGSDKVFEIVIKETEDHFGDDSTALRTLIDDIYINEILTADVLADSIVPSIKDYIYSRMSFKDLCDILQETYSVACALCKRMIYLIVYKLSLYTTIDNHIYIRSI